MLGNSFYGTQDCHRATGYLGDISASGQLVLALIQWFNPGNKACFHSPEQLEDSPPCAPFLSQFSGSQTFK